jgi:hypothetical protein
LKLINGQLTIAGVLGLLAAILVGSGEFLLHFDALGRFAEGGAYEFMRGINAERTTIGHFLGVLSAPLYIIGFWHLMKMLEPANALASRIAFAIVSYGIIVGAVWIGSRAGISTIVNSTSILNPMSFISLYELRYENLLQVTRLAVLIFSVIFIWLVLTGRSHYPRWMALLNPILLILASFAIWMVAPAVGVYLMPIALNVAFALLFLFSIYYSKKVKE